jgi:hypothetical protein
MEAIPFVGAYRKWSPASPPKELADKLSVPRKEAEHIYDIKYFSRDMRRAGYVFSHKPPVVHSRITLDSVEILFPSLSRPLSCWPLPFESPICETIYHRTIAGTRQEVVAVQRAAAGDLQHVALKEGVPPPPGPMIDYGKPQKGYIYENQGYT